MQQRPTGITILAVLSAIGGVLGVFSGLIIVMGGGILGAATGSASVGFLVILLGAIACVVGVVGVALAYGFWTIAPWAWPLGVALELVERRADDRPGGRRRHVDLLGDHQRPDPRDHPVLPQPARDQEALRSLTGQPSHVGVSRGTADLTRRR